jgi:NAD(P)-dependent dehydrogenase (short-subunit alcohol dehydrogenase family)
MTQIIIITGASSGFGRLAAHAMAKSGHTAYAGMRDTAGRNAPQVEALQAYAAQTGVDLRAVELARSPNPRSRQPSPRSCRRAGGSIPLSTMPVTWCSVRPRRSHQNNTQRRMT